MFGFPRPSRVCGLGFAGGFLKAHPREAWNFHPKLQKLGVVHLSDIDGFAIGPAKAKIAGLFPGKEISCKSLPSGVIITTVPLP